MQTLTIRLHGKTAGLLKQQANGKMQFQYDSSSSMPLSIGMPIRTNPYDDKRCEAYFGGLLPESETTRRIIAKRFGISAGNSFSLLKAIGYDCAGAVSCHSENDSLHIQQEFSLTARPVPEAELLAHIKNLPKVPLFLDIPDLRLSLAGAQDKAAVCLVDQHIAFPLEGCPTTHILKPNNPHFEGLVENEYFCLLLAKKIGIDTPEVQLRQIEDTRFLLIERYDRNVKNNIVSRIHQEDFCQALGYTTQQKYQNEDGPSLKNCFDLLMETQQPARERQKLLELVIFNYFVGNMDAHGKNFSLLQSFPNQFSLAPAYDLICTRVYQNLSSKMAMKIGGHYQSEYLLQRHWERFAEDIDYSFPALKRLLIKQGETILQCLSSQKTFFQDKTHNAEIVNKIIRFIENHIQHTLKKFK